MKKTATPIKDLFIIDPSVYGDHRGYFLEIYNKKVFDDVLDSISFVQDNESLSSRGVLRGLHFQNPPYAQAKLVRCIQGEVMDVAVDLRKDSDTYGAHFSIKLNGDNKKQLFVPRGFAHGFVVLSETAIISYKVDNHYAPEHDSGILWNDPALGIDWGISDDEVIISDKDKQLKPISKTDIHF